MPYPIAHPAAVLPLCKVMGRFAVPSALGIGSIVPDLWYVVPGLVRMDSHSAGGLLWFCMPVALVVYMAFHLLLKQPLLALLPAGTAARAGHYATPSLPPASWLAVICSLFAGAATHAAWDALTHASSTSMWLFPVLDDTFLSIGRYEMNGYQLLQHSSTILGTAIVVWWVKRKLEIAPPTPRAMTPALPPRIRAAIAAGLLAITASAAWSAGMPLTEGHLDLVSLRLFARAAGFAGLWALGLAVLGYCALWHAWRLQATSD